MHANLQGNVAAMVIVVLAVAVVVASGCVLLLLWLVVVLLLLLFFFLMVIRRSCLFPPRWKCFAQDISPDSKEMEENFTKNLMSLAIIVAATFDVAVAFYLIGRITSPFLPPPQFARSKSAFSSMWIDQFFGLAICFRRFLRSAPSENAESKQSFPMHCRAES